jgi:hypothetical protein
MAQAAALSAHLLVAMILVMTAAMAAGATADGREVVPVVARPFPLPQVRLLDGPFKRDQDLSLAFLLALDPDRLLHTFRIQAGLASSAQPLGGWEEPKGELRGHSMGHYLTGIALMYAVTGDARLKDRADYIVAELAKCQAKFPSGYLSAYPEEFIDRVVAGRRVWAPWYTLHKIYAGLVDVHLMCGNAQALDVMKKAAAWIASRTDPLSDADMEKMLGNEHGGMNDVLADLYGVTGDPKHLALSRRFNHHAVLDPLTRREDRLTGLHANTQFPKVLGAVRQYELAGDKSLLTAGTFFWDVVTRERSYATGGNSDGEHFSPKDRLSEALGPNTTETCNTYNMLRLTRRLFCLDPKAEYADYYERALLSHILASINPETGMMVYYLKLRTGSVKEFSTVNGSFWCCTGTGMENPARFNEAIYFHDDAGLWVNLFMASEVAWPEKGLRLRQETLFPELPETTLRLALEKPADLALRLRRPAWCADGFAVSVNGEPVRAGAAPGSWVEVKRTWRDGDAVRITLPMTLRTEAFADNPRRLALLYGPVVLCAPVAHGAQPVFTGDPAGVPGALRPVVGRPLVFEGDAGRFVGTGAEEGGRVQFIPFYREYARPTIVYWDCLTPAQLQAREEARKAEEARAKDLDARTLDRVAIGDEASEKAHNRQGSQTYSGVHSGRTWRHATDGGWFAYDLKVAPDAPAELLVTYWGGDSGNRTFDILIDGQKVAEQRLASADPGRFLDKAYAVPADMTKGKEKVTVRFQARPGNFAGGVFGLRVLRK